jgi:hypothetical protein
MDPDISIWRKTGHFYFALTKSREHLSCEELCVSDSVIPQAMHAPSSSPESAYATQESHQLVRALLREMTPILRQALSMTYEHEMSLADASAFLGVSLGAYKARLFRARQVLKQQAEQHSLLSTSRRRAVRSCFQGNGKQKLKFAAATARIFADDTFASVPIGCHRA